MTEPVPSTAVSNASVNSAQLKPIKAVRRIRWRLILAAVVLLTLLLLALCYYVSREPARFNPLERAQQRAASAKQQVVPGYVTTATLIELTETLLNKRGGYLSNDYLPPGVLLDNMPNFEFGVVQQLRDLSLALRNDFSRSQTQSQDDKDLAEAQPLYASPNDRWIIPSTEGQYGKASDHVNAYLQRLANPAQPSAQFYTRADNLESYLRLVEKQLGSLGQRLSASAAHRRINVDLANDPNAEQSTPSSSITQVRTPWLQIDDNFYEARGAAYALLHILRAIEHDFAPVLANKNAGASVKQILRELEETQGAIWSPMILNGGGFGFFANHSLVMANYISRAGAQVSDLRQLLQRG
jgi:hypothetical protein